MDDEVLLGVNVGRGLYRRFLHLRALRLGCEHGVDELRFAPQALQGGLAGRLLALLLRVAFATSALQPFNQSGVDEHGAVAVVTLLADEVELQLHLVLLAPLDELALEVHLLVGNLVKVDELRQYALLHEAHASVVTAVQVDCPDEGLERISFHITVMRGHVAVGHDELAYAYFGRQAVESVALHNLASRACEEALALAFEVAEHYVADNGVEDGVAQEFKPLVVDGPPLGVALVDAAVHEGLFVQVDVVRVKSEY